MPLDKIVDIEARAEIAKHKAVCEQVYLRHEASFARNDNDHLEIKSVVRGLAEEARKRWWVLFLLVISGMGAIIMSLFKIKYTGPF